MPRATRERIEAILVNCLKHGLESQNRERDPHFLEALRGRVTWVEHVNPSQATKLRRLLAELDSGVGARQSELEGALRQGLELTSRHQ